MINIQTDITNIRQMEGQMNRHATSQGRDRRRNREKTDTKCIYHKEEREREQNNPQCSSVVGKKIALHFLKNRLSL